jgi:tetratricopeptide (TPR) repeat protein
LFGLNARGHHLTSLLFHVANTLLLFVVLNKMTGAVWRSGLVSALFGLHPLHVESVAWVAERKDVLSTFFFMLTLWAYARYAEVSGVRCQVSRAGKDEARMPKAEGRAKSESRSQGTTSGIQHPISSIQPPASAPCYILCLVCFALGLMSKPMLVTVPLVLLLLDYWPLGRLQSSAAGKRGASLLALAWEKAPFLVLAVADSLITYWAQKQGGAIEAMPEVPLPSRLANALVSFLRYLGKAFWPADLAVFYPFPPPWPVWKVAGTVAVLAAISGFAILARRRQPYLLVGWLWYVITLAPVIGIIQIGAQGLADRYTYIPLIGIGIIVSWTAGTLAERFRRTRMLAGVCVLGVALSLALTRAQVRLWRSNETLFRHALAVTTNNDLAHYLLGYSLIGQQRFQEAEGQLRAALRINADYPVAEAALGVTLAHEGNTAEAISHFETALRLSPDYAVGHFDLASALAGQGDTDRALHHYEEAVRLDPEFAPAHKGLADALQRKGRGDKAIIQYREALRWEPDNAQSHGSLATVLAAQGKMEEALAHFSAAARLNPSSAKAQNSLGWALATQGRTAEAVACFSAALTLNPEYAEAHYNLANVLVEARQPADARRHFEQALRTQPDFAEAHRQFALLLSDQHALPEATAHFQAALRLRPNDPSALRGLAWIYATAPDPALRNGPAAVELAQRAATLTGERESAVLETLAAACAEAGRFDQAIQEAQRALEIATAANETNAIFTLAHQLKLYQSGQRLRR